MEKENERLIRAIESTKRLPENWTIDITFDRDIGRVYLDDPDGNFIEPDEMYGDFATLAEQLENAVAYAIANDKGVDS